VLGCQIYKTIWKNGFCHSFRFFVFNGRDESVFREGICDAQDVFVLTSGSQHGAKEVRMDADVGLVGRWQRL